MYFRGIIVRGAFTKAEVKFPMNALWKELELRRLTGLYDLPKKGLKIRVYRLVKTEDGVEEEEIP
jgi:hypothetical protein